jgi:hypothetical protein
MSTPLNVPEITIEPSNVPCDLPDKILYCWKMQLHEESILDSEDHGDEFYSVEEALAHAYTVFEDLVNRRQLYPCNEEQSFHYKNRVTVGWVIDNSGDSLLNCLRGLTRLLDK